MSNRLPLVLDAGQVRQLPAGDTLIGSTASAGVLTLKGTSHATPGTVKMADPHAVAVATTASITANTNDLSISGAGYLRMSLSSAWQVTGIAAGVDGQVLRLMVATGTLILPYDSASSVAANRLYTPSATALTLTQYESAQFIYDATLARWVCISGHILPGLIYAYGPNQTPSLGWLICDGAAVSRTTYAGLFGVLSTTWGVGDGSTTFNVPDLRGRTLLGSGTGTGLTARSVGQTGGEETHVLTVAEMPAHTHNVQFDTAGTAGANQRRPVGYTGSASQVASQSQGGDTAHQNMQPWACSRYYIKI